jgi:uncharacterized protein YecT (DUF1311 family)
MRVLLPAIAIALLPALANAACEAAGDDLATLDCLRAEHARADAELNRIWPRVLADAPSGGDPEMQRGAIRDAQRAWIIFRDADCAAASTLGIPRYWEMNRLRCLVDHTRARTASLSRTYLGQTHPGRGG